MLLRASRLCLGFAGAVALLLSFAGTSVAQEITAHPLDISLKVVSQRLVNMRYQYNRFTAKEQDIFDACVGRPPAKGEAVYVFVNCDAIESSPILAIRTEPLTRLAEVGSLEIDEDRALYTSNKNFELDSIRAPATISVECDGAVFQARGIAHLTLKTLVPGEECLYSGSVKVSGSGTVPEELLIDEGSKVSLKKRSRSISVIPPAP